jgi:hypothetical protein
LLKTTDYYLLKQETPQFKFYPSTTLIELIHVVYSTSNSEEPRVKLRKMKGQLWRRERVTGMRW